MCMTCGCGIPDDPHGDDRNIVYDQIKDAAAAAGISDDQAADNIKSALANVER